MTLSGDKEGGVIRVFVVKDKIKYSKIKELVNWEFWFI